MLYKFNKLICKLHTGIIHPPLQCNQHSSSLRIKILLGNHEFESTTVWKRYVQMYLRRGAKTLSAVAMRWFVSTKVHRLIILGLILTIQIYRPFVESQQILTETAAVHWMSDFILLFYGIAEDRVSPTSPLERQAHKYWGNWMACLPIEWKYIDISATAIKWLSGKKKEGKKETLFHGQLGVGKHIKKHLLILSYFCEALSLCNPALNVSF